MHSESSVTHWLDELRDGHASLAHQRLWQEYFHRLVALARTRLRGQANQAADEEDVALSALNAFFLCASQGRYPDLKDRSELWPLLVKIVTTKAANQVKRQRALKRGAGRVVNERTAQDSSSAAGVLENIAASEPTPELIAQVTEQCNRLFESLEDDQLRVIVRLKLEG